MKKVILIALGVIVTLLAVFVIAVLMQPNDLHVERSTTIDAPPAEVFAHVNDFHQWEAWSPWIERDPNAKNSYSGADAGEGAKFSWDGNDDVGEGSMVIAASKPNDRIDIDLAFVRPFEDTSDVSFTFTPVDGKTKVSWEMNDTHNFMSKTMCLFMDMDKMIGDDFEAGLANMKQIVEAAAPTDVPQDNHVDVENEE